MLQAKYVPPFCFGVPADVISLDAFNCQPVRFEAELSDSLAKDFPEGLNSRRTFHFVFVDIGMIGEDDLKTMRELQPAAKFVFMCDSMNLANAMKRFDLKVCPFPLLWRPVLICTEREYSGSTHQACIAL